MIPDHLIPLTSCIRRLISCLLLVPAIFLLPACEEIMDISFTGDTTQNLVVEGTITTDTLRHRVVLSYTADYFNQPARVMATGAEVTISDGDTTYVLMEVHNGEYYTDSTVFGIPGKTYTLDVRFSDGRSFAASDVLEPCPGFDSISQSVNYKTFDGDYGYDVLFYGKDPEVPGNNYLYLLYVNNELYTDSLPEMVFVNDEFVNGQQIRDYTVYRIREADVSDSLTMVTLEMHSITPAYYDFLSGLLLETVWKGSPWDGPPANVAGNISNGARGYFRASGVMRRSRVFLETPRVN